MVEMNDKEPLIELYPGFIANVKFSNIPVHTSKTNRFSSFTPTEGTEKAKQAAIDFITGKLSRHFLTFVGKSGLGKTHLALGIGWEWLEQNMGRVKYWQVESLLDELRAGMGFEGNKLDDSFTTTMNVLKKVPLLILDDLGAEKPTEWALAKLDEVIDYRNIQNLKTVFTTNALSERLAPRILSRIKGGIVVLITGEDYREKQGHTIV